MSTYTPNYQLHQWEPEDHFLRSDFNQDFSRIDTAIQGVKTTANSAVAAVRGELQTAKNTLTAVDATKCEVYVGTYSGDGASSRRINLGFEPKAVLVEEHRLRSSGNATYGGLAVRGCDLICPGATALSVNASGFTVYYIANTVYTNMSGCNYLYVAFK